MGPHEFSRSVLYIENEKRKSPLPRHLRVKLSERARCTVPRVRERFFPISLLPLVRLCKILTGHVDFPPDFQISGHSGKRLPDIRDDPGIQRHILSDHPVSAGLRENKFSVLVAERHRKPVDFLFHTEFCVRMKFSDRIYPFNNIFLIKDVLDREHGHVMGHSDAGLPLYSRTHSLCRGAAPDKARPGLLVVLQG